MSLKERLEYAAMKARHANVLRPWYKKWWGILILVILGLALIYLIASIFYVISQIQSIRSGQAQTDLAEQTRVYQAAVIGTGGDYAYGTSSPQVTVVEFGDFACPFCAQSATGARAIMAEYKDRVRFIYRDYPLHDNSIDLALAARCAGEQNKFWETYDYFFAHQTSLTDTGDALKTKLLNLASDLKLDLTQFNDCFTNKKYLDNISRDFSDGETLQIQGTPTWFVNFYPVTGYLPADKLQELIGGLIK